MKKNKALNPPASPIDTERMLKHGNEYYVIDVESFASKITMMSEDEEEEMHLPKYELYKLLIDVLLSPTEEGDGEDEVLRHIKQHTRQPFDFKVAFNTLIKDEILKIYE